MLSLISGRNSDLLIGQHVKSAFKIKETNLEILPCGYMLIEGENLTSAIYISESLPIPKDKFDIAAAVQVVYEQRLNQFMRMAKRMTGKNNLVFMGGCALNSSANTLLWNIFDMIWIMPNPGDAGSSVGAVAAFFGEQVNWPGAYLGTNMGKEYPVDETISILTRDKIVGVASGKAEFGPRALGHRSLLADPRGSEIKDTVNAIKRRQQFRPFAPAILEEHVHDYFDMPANITASPYMQFVARCRTPDLLPGVCHVDNTSLGMYAIS